ncbi:Uncharacterised protein [Burkholderia pseudomallei]|nr:Uncharacterised protein [Burkholderia pseudomallei]
MREAFPVKLAQAADDRGLRLAGPAVQVDRVIAGAVLALVLPVRRAALEDTPQLSLRGREERVRRRIARAFAGVEEAPGQAEAEPLAALRGERGEDLRHRVLGAAERHVGDVVFLVHQVAVAVPRDHDHVLEHVVEVGQEHAIALVQAAGGHLAEHDVDVVDDLLRVAPRADDAPDLARDVRVRRAILDDPACARLAEPFDHVAQPAHPAARERERRDRLDDLHDADRRGEQAALRFEVRLAALGQIQIAECIAVPIAVREQRGEQRRAMARVARVLRGEQHAAVDEQMTVAVAGRIDEQLRPDLEERDALRRGRAADRGHGRGQLPVGGQRGLRDAPIAALGGRAGLGCRCGRGFGGGFDRDADRGVGRGVGRGRRRGRLARRLAARRQRRPRRTRGLAGLREPCAGGEPVRVLVEQVGAQLADVFVLEEERLRQTAEIRLDRTRRVERENRIHPVARERRIDVEAVRRMAEHRADLPRQIRDDRVPPRRAVVGRRAFSRYRCQRRRRRRRRRQRRQ